MSRLRKVDMNRNGSGLLTGFPLHDVDLVAFSYRDEDFDLTFKKGIEQHNIRLVRITENGFSGFKFNAILSEIFLWKVGEVPDSILSLKDGAWADIFGANLDASRLKLEVERLVTSRAESWLVQFNFSYGGSFSAVCREVQIKKLSFEE